MYLRDVRYRTGASRRSGRTSRKTEPEVEVQIQFDVVIQKKRRPPKDILDEFIRDFKTGPCADCWPSQKLDVEQLDYFDIDPSLEPSAPWPRYHPPSRRCSRPMPSA